MTAAESWYASYGLIRISYVDGALEVEPCCYLTNKLLWTWLKISFIVASSSQEAFHGRLLSRELGFRLMAQER